MAKNLEIEFLELLEQEDGIPKDIDVTDFLLEKFPVPNLADLEVSYLYTDALIFIRKSDKTKYWWYDDAVLSPIRDKFNYDIDGNKYRYWFNTMKSGLQKPFYARITDSGMHHLYEYRTNEILKITNRSIVDTNKALKVSLYTQIAIGIITMVAIGLTAVYAIMAYKKDDPKSLIEISKSLQRQEQLLDSIRLLQKERNTSLKIMAKKTLPKKK